jgi:site-specific DNA-methyltransferase (adenine-specific)
MSQRVEQLAEGVTLYCGDCREVLPHIGTWPLDACVTDPPYGLGDKWQGGPKWKLHHGSMQWDAEICDHVVSLPGIFKHAIIWGGHLYDLPPQRGWLVWDKLVRNFTSGHCEFAWTTLDQPIRAFNFAHGELATEGKFHPTQKPVALMKWCLEQLPAGVEQVCDPYMGSGTTGVACVSRGLQFVGIEREPKYFDIACKRISDALKQPDFFIERPAPPRQEGLAL